MKWTRKGSGWQSRQQEKAQGLAALREELQETPGVLASARAIFNDDSTSSSGKVFTLGEIIADASTTPVGRVITAACALTLAYWLI
jgi:hypothetical protein